jgi:hypothetical protein
MTSRTDLDAVAGLYRAITSAGQPCAGTEGERR